jgi:hypothetical protein
MERDKIILLVKIVLILPVIGQLYLSFRLFTKEDYVGAVIFLITAFVWSIVALNYNKIMKK